MGRWTFLLGLCCVFFGGGVTAYAQPQVEWTSTYALENTSAILDFHVIPGGSYLLLVGYWINGDWDSLSVLRVIHFTPEGNEIWSRDINASPGWPSFPSGRIAPAADGGCLALIRFNQVLRLSADGDSLWEYSYAESAPDFRYFRVSGGVQADDGGWLIAGSAEIPPGSQLYRTLILKLDAAGNLEENFAYDQPGSRLLTRLTSGALATVVSPSSTGPDRVLFFSTAGNSLTRAVDYEFEILSVTPDQTGGLVLAPPGYPFYLHRTNPLGEVLWGHQYAVPGVMGDGATMVDTLANGHILAMVGQFFEFDFHACLLSVDANGDSLWSHCIQLEDSTWATQMRTTPDGGCIVGLMTGGYAAWTSGFALMKLSLPEAADSKPVPLVTEFALHAPYPNPFNPSTLLSFSLPRAGMVTLRVYNTLGQEVARPLEQPLGAGDHHVAFDGTTLPSGIYFARLQAGADVRTQKLMLLK